MKTTGEKFAGSYAKARELRAQQHKERVKQQQQ